MPFNLNVGRLPSGWFFKLHIGRVMHERAGFETRKLAVEFALLLLETTP